MLWLMDFFDQPVRNCLITYVGIQKIATDQGDDYTTGRLLDYNYFKKHYKWIAIDLNKQQTLDADPNVIQQIKFTENLERKGNQIKQYFLLLKKQKKPF